jgi:hypothetical protein
MTFPDWFHQVIRKIHRFEFGGVYFSAQEGHGDHRHAGEAWYFPNAAAKLGGLHAGHIYFQQEQRGRPSYRGGFGDLAQGFRRGFKDFQGAAPRSEKVGEQIEV